MRRAEHATAVKAKFNTGDHNDPRVPNDPRLILFAAGDFAFNLFWQSTMLFLLFYYTEALNLPIGVAGTIFLVASVWDGLANFITGLVVDRKAGTMSYRALLMVGALPLSLTFVLAYLPPAAPGWIGITSVLVCHLLFRTAYAAVNVPYLAMSARISGDGHKRAFVAGMRMMFGTLALVVVAVGTIPIGNWLTGQRDPVEAYLGAAMVFAIVAAAILLIVGSTYRDSAGMPAREPVAVRAALISLARNRAFVTLNVAMMAMIVAITILNKSVLYYFKYLLNDPGAGQLALASMGLVSALTVPLWMLSERWFGLRGLWLAASGAAMVGLTVFAAFDIHRSDVMQMFLMGMQALIVGLNFVFWAMLPNTIEYGERTTGLHVEGAVFGVAAFLQRIAIGVAVAILGWSFDSAGYVANVTQSTATTTGMRLTVALVPLLFFAISCAAMILNPLGGGNRGGHPR